MTYAVVSFRKVWRKSESSMHMVNPVYVKSRASRWNPFSSTLQCDRLQHDSPVAYVIAQKYIFPPSSHCTLIPARKISARSCRRVPLQHKGYMTSFRMTIKCFPSPPVSCTSDGRPTSSYKNIKLFTLSLSLSLAQVIPAVPCICRWKLDRSLTSAYW